MGKQSPLYSINLSDALKGLIMAVATPVVLIVQQSLSAGNLTLNWKLIGMTAVSAALAYLAKQFFTSSTPTIETTTTAAGTVTKEVIQTDSVDVNVKPPQQP